MHQIKRTVGSLGPSIRVFLLIGACTSAHEPQRRPASVCVASDTAGAVETIVLQTSEAGDACFYTYFTGPPADPAGGIPGVESSGDYALQAFGRAAGACVPATVPRFHEGLAGSSDATGTVTAQQNGDGIDVTIRATVSFRAGPDGTPPTTEELDVVLSAAAIPACERPSL